MTPYEVHTSELPLRVDAGDPIYAVGRVFVDNSGIRGSSLFTILNPVIRLDSYSSTGTVGQIQVVHPNLLDSNSDKIRVGYFELDSLQFMHTYDNIYKYRGWLLTAKAYDPETAKKIIALTDGDNPEDDPYLYLPPDVIIRGYAYPFPVTVEVCYSTEDILKDWLKHIEEN